jgi:hypothetical protein
VNLAAGTAVVCATGHRPQVIFDTGPASDEPAECVGLHSRLASEWSLIKPRLRNAPEATPGAEPSRPRGGQRRPSAATADGQSADGFNPPRRR